MGSILKERQSPALNFCIIGTNEIQISMEINGNLVSINIYNYKNKTLGRARDPRTNGAWPSKQTE